MTAFTTTGGTSHSESITGLTNGGSYVYYVKCQDGQSITNSSDYTISFTVAADTTSPTVTVTAPSNNATVSGSSVTISADATDDVSVSGVQFKLDTNTLIGSEDILAPYSLIWDSTAVADGTGTIIAVGRDGSGSYATSSAVTITVHNHNAVASAHSSIGGGGCSPGFVWNAGKMGCVQTVAPVTTTTNPSTVIVYPLLPPTIPSIPLNKGITLTKNRQIWDRGEDIRVLQKWFNNNGFIIAITGPGSPGNETSIFGTRTYRTLVKFQKSQGLPQTGYLGPLTRGAILNFK